MTQQATEAATAPPAANPAAEQRRAMIAALAAQQKQLDVLREANVNLAYAIAFIATAAGISGHPVIAALGIQTVADVDNPAQPIPSPAAEGPSETTQQARQPDATDTVTSPGGTPGSTEGVAPAGTTDVNAPGTTLGDVGPDATADVEKPVAGTDTVPTPAAAQIPIDITPPTLSDPGAAFPETGWTSTGGKAPEGEHRLLKSVRLARLRKAADIEQGDDLGLGQQIAESDMTSEAIDTESATLAKVLERRASGQGASMPRVARSLVPPKTGAGTARAMPSLAPQGEPIHATGGSTIPEDELSFF